MDIMVIYESLSHKVGDSFAFNITLYNETHEPTSLIDDITIRILFSSRDLFKCSKKYEDRKSHLGHIHMLPNKYI